MLKKMIRKKIKVFNISMHAQAHRDITSAWAYHGLAWVVSEQITIFYFLVFGFFNNLLKGQFKIDAFFVYAQMCRL